MNTQNDASTPQTRDRELEQHLVALGFLSIEEYVQWCARHGFSTRVEKHWHQRCKEQFYALRQKLKNRSDCRKRESRRPKILLLQIANNELATENLTQPHLVSISNAFTSLEGSARDAFLRLLLHVQDHGNLFDTGSIISQFGTQAGNTFIDALSVLAKHHGDWLRPVKDWQPRTHNSRRQFSSLVRYLLTKYEVPTFMDSVWFKGKTLEAHQQQNWFVQIGRGINPRLLDIPVCLTNRMVGHFLQAPSNYTVEASFRWAQVLGLGGNVCLVEAILGSKLATDFTQEDFWGSVIRWLIANPKLNTRHVAPLIDYIHHQKFELQNACTVLGETESHFLQPNFTIKGRTPDSLLRQMHEWHKDLRKQPQQIQVSWYETGIDGFDWTEGSLTAGDLRRWTIREILNRKDLFAEGCAMRHCVASYENSCSSGQSSIWSMGIERNNGRRKRVLTVEVAVRRKVICQVRGKTNRLPTAKEIEILRRWAVQEGLTLDASVRAR
jgi:hypothetical protein